MRQECHAVLGSLELKETLLLAVVFGPSSSATCYQGAFVSLCVASAADSGRRSAKTNSQPSTVWVEVEAGEIKQRGKCPSYHGSMENNTFFFLRTFGHQSNCWWKSTYPWYSLMIFRQVPITWGCNPMVDAHNGKTPPFQMNLRHLAGLCRQMIGAFRRQNGGPNGDTTWSWLIYSVGRFFKTSACCQDLFRFNVVHKIDVEAYSCQKKTCRRPNRFWWNLMRYTVSDALDHSFPWLSWRCLFCWLDPEGAQFSL